jgi:hypothetical protein
MEGVIALGSQAGRSRDDKIAQRQNRAATNMGHYTTGGNASPGFSTGGSIRLMQIKEVPTDAGKL